jgi:hypothetical protein
MSNYPVADEEDYKGYHIEIKYDESPFNPREMNDGYVGKMLFFHTRYILGDEHHLRSKDFSNWTEIEEYIEKELDGVAILPVRMYDHSGISISLSSQYPYNDYWDSGQIGFIYTTRKIMKEQLGIKYLSKNNLKKIYQNYEYEIDEYNAYLNGEVYGYLVHPIEEDEDYHPATCLDSCWGYFGDEGFKYAKQSAKEHIDWLINHPKTDSESASVA